MLVSKEFLSLLVQCIAQIDSKSHTTPYNIAVNLPGTSSYLPEETNLHRFYTPRTYIKHYDRLLASSYSKTASKTTLLSDDDIERLLDSLRIAKDRRDILVGDSFRRGLTLGEQRRLELGLMVLGAPDTVSRMSP